MRRFKQWKALYEIGNWNYIKQNCSGLNPESESSKLLAKEIMH
jgi:hypothetical protein